MIAAPLATNNTNTPADMALKTSFEFGEKSVTLIASFTCLADFRLKGRGRPPGPRFARTSTLASSLGALTIP